MPPGAVAVHSFSLSRHASFDPSFDHTIDAEFWAAFAKTYPNITVEKQSFSYNEILDKIRTAALGKAAPMVARSICATLAGTVRIVCFE